MGPTYWRDKGNGRTIVFLVISVTLVEKIVSQQ
jgi:hypothetical protein